MKRFVTGELKLPDAETNTNGAHVTVKQEDPVHSSWEVETSNPAENAEATIKIEIPDFKLENITIKEEGIDSQQHEVSCTRKSLAAQHLRTAQPAKNKSLIPPQSKEPQQSQRGSSLTGSSQANISEGSLSQKCSRQQRPSKKVCSLEGSSKEVCSRERTCEPLMSEMVTTKREIRTREFHVDLCLALMASDIPLTNVTIEPFRDFFKKYSGRSLPDQSTLQKYVCGMYEDTMRKLRKKANKQKLWVSIDVTTDIEQRYIACFVFGVLGVKGEREKFYLGNVAVLPKVNHSSVVAFFNDSLQYLWARQMQYENVFLVVTDTAPHMVKAMNEVSSQYPRMIYVTCLAHGLHRVAELVRSTYPEVNGLISSGKRIFMEAPHRVQRFKEMCPEIPLPPSPVLTRWGTWLNAASYYTRYYEEISSVIKSFECDECSSVKECRNLLDNAEVKTCVSSISSTFTILSSTIEQLETRGLSISDVISKINTVKEDLTNTNTQRYYQKLSFILSKNRGYKIMENVSSILCRNYTGSTNHIISKFTLNDLSCLEYAPLVSCEVERVFPQFKSILADNRSRFNFENLKYNLIVKCNELN